MAKGLEEKGITHQTPLKRKLYSRPTVTKLGEVGEMTRGENFSHFDPGHSLNNKHLDK
jgi:hypothetical protein